MVLKYKTIMKNIIFRFLLIFILISCKGNQLQSQNKIDSVTDFNALSESFLTKIKNGEDTQEIQNTFANVSIKELASSLDTNNKRLAFWINIYNGYIQVILKKNPDLYKDRGSFFKMDQIAIAGDTVSFAKIEHGLIRKSQYEYGLGYIRKWFPNKFERKLRVKHPVYKVHFALNCGAKDCPPVAIYEWQRLDEQFNKGTKDYLNRTTEYDSKTKTAAVTSLFSWFRGDFGGKSGTKKILNDYGLIPATKGVELKFKNYDWTLDLDNFIDL